MNDIRERHPSLCRWPRRVGAWLQRHPPPGADGDVAHVLYWMTTLCEHRQALHPDRIPERTFTGHVGDLLAITASLAAAARRAGTTMRALLPFDSEPPTMVAVVALALQEKRRVSPRGLRTFCGQWANSLLLGVRCAIFPRGVGLCRSMLSVRALLAGGDAEPEPGPTRRRDPITADEVDQLLARGCRGPMETALVVLLATAAPRLAAIADMRVEAVWDGARRRVRDRFCIREKLSQCRQIVPRAALRDALTALLVSSWPGREYVFEYRCGRRPVARTLALLLDGICQRAQVRRLNPHLFRSYVVNEGVRNGVPLHSMAKYMGHRDVVTTSRYYLTEDLAGVVRGILVAEDDTLDALRSRITAAERELRQLQTTV